MRLIEALEQGVIKEFGKPERILETALSKLFFFGDKVVKVYKHGKYFFANLEDLEPRRKFLQDDFFWNHAAAPEIYKELNGVRKGTFEKVDVSRGDDFYILMNKIDGSATLTNLLGENKLLIEDTKRATVKLIKLLRLLTSKKIHDFKHLTDMGWLKLWQKETVDSCRSWLEMAGEYIPHAENKRIMDIFENASNRENYFTRHDLSCFTIVADNNCDNFVFLNGQPSFLDIMPPKDGWRIADEYAVVARTAVDAHVLGGSEHGQAVYDVYRNYRADAPESVKLLYEIRAALIQWPYRHISGQHELAEKYKQFVLPKINALL